MSLWKGQLEETSCCFVYSLLGRLRDEVANLKNMTSYVRYTADSGKQNLVYPEPVPSNYPVASSSSAAYPDTSLQPGGQQQLQTSPILRLTLAHKIKFWGPPFQIDYINNSIISPEQADEIKDNLDKVAIETGPRRATIIGLSFIGAVLFVLSSEISYFISFIAIIACIIGITVYTKKGMERRKEAVERFVNFEMAGDPLVMGKGWRLQTQTLAVGNINVLYVEVWDHAPPFPSSTFTPYNNIGYAPVYYPAGGVGYTDSAVGYGYGAAPVHVSPPVYSPPPTTVGYTGQLQQAVVQTYNPARM